MRPAAGGRTQVHDLAERIKRQSNAFKLAGLATMINADNAEIGLRGRTDAVTIEPSAPSDDVATAGPRDAASLQDQSIDEIVHLLLGEDQDSSDEASDGRSAVRTAAHDRETMPE